MYKAPSIKQLKFARRESFVHKVHLSPKIAQLALFPTPPASQEKTNVRTAPLGGTASKQEERSPLVPAEQVIIAPLDRTWIMLYHVQLVCIALQVSFYLMMNKGACLYGGEMLAHVYFPWYNLVHLNG